MKAMASWLRELVLHAGRYGVTVVGTHFFIEGVDFDLEGFPFALFSA